MAEEQGTQEKTEEPTSRKIEKSQEDGQVLTSKEMFVFTSIFVGLLVIMFITSFIPSFLEVWKKLFIFNSEGIDFFNPLISVGKLIKYIMIIVLIIGVPMLLTSIITQFCVGGNLIFSLKAMAPKLNKLDPISGLRKKIFSMKSLMELVKSILKVSLLGGTAFLIIQNDITTIINLADRDLNQAIKGYFILFPKMTIALLIILAIIAFIDYLWERHQHIEKLKMTIKEVKDEMKDTDGSPEVKQKIRRLQNEISQRASKQTAALDDVKDASVIITNPTHFAVALKYDVGSEGAPVILALGRGMMAEKIIDLAKDSNVTIFRSPILARALYFTGEIGQEISDKLYTAVAAILAYIFKVDKGETEINDPEIQIPDDLIFDEYGNKNGEKDEK